MHHPEHCSLPQKCQRIPDVPILNNFHSIQFITCDTQIRHLTGNFGFGLLGGRRPASKSVAFHAGPLWRPYWLGQCRCFEIVPTLGKTRNKLTLTGNLSKQNHTNTYPYGYVLSMTERYSCDRGLPETFAIITPKLSWQH